MRFKIHFTLPSGEEDFVIISGETIDEIRSLAKVELSIRDATNEWSESFE